MIYKIYALYDLSNPDIFKYIGSSQQKYLAKRKSQHIEKAKINYRNSKKDQWIRSINFNIGIKLLHDNIETLEEALNLEDEYIKKYKDTITNTESSRPKPPYMAGNNYIPLSQEIIDQLGTMPDYKLAKLYHLEKTKIADERRKRNIISYAESTGNNGQFKQGEEHRRWKNSNKGGTLPL